MLVAKISASDAHSVAADVLVVVATADHRVLAPADVLSTSHRRAIGAALQAMGDADTTTLPGSVIERSGTIQVASAQSPVTPESIRRAFGAAVLALSGSPTLAVIAPDDTPAMMRAAIEGARLGAYRFDRYKSTGQIKRLTIVVSSPVSREQRAAATAANIVSDGVQLARDLVNTAPNDLGPADFAAVATESAADLPITVKVWDDKALRRGGFGGLTAVGQGSARGPRLVRLSYTPAKASRHVALVGKGITFDSGGLSLKPAKAMEWMKSDMGGAAAVLATVLSVARLKLPVAVTGWLALAENMPSGTAQRPGDVITIRGGTTIEVLNTDAEGRLVLADAIVEAAKANPDALIDVATLTGAQLVALGSRVAGAMGNDDEQRAAVVAAADACGESMWPMPLPRELRASLDSAIADMANIGDRNGGMLTAALFLQEFVPEDLPWTHLDIAGPAFNEGAVHDYTPKGGTGFGVRTLVQYLRDNA